MKPIFYPSLQNDKHQPASQTAGFIFIAFLLLLGALSIVNINVDHPFSLLDTFSRALYVDEGFYADAAQNLKKFGQWDMPLDSRHWPGAPFLASVQSLIFSIFGVSLTAARLISIFFSLVSGLALYSMSRTSFTPWVSLALSISALLTFNYIGFSRAAITDPVATSMSMLALLVFVRVRPKALAIPLSLLLAYLAFFSKMYFLFTFVTLAVLWAAELLVLPFYFKTIFDKRAISVFLASLLIIALSYAVFRTLFSAEVANFLYINGNKTPSLNLAVLINHFDDAIEKMPYHSKSPYFIYVLLAASLYFIVSRLWPSKFKTILVDAQKLGRAEWAMGAFFCSGFVLVGMLAIHKAHYHYFTILPLAFLVVAAVNLIFTGRIKTALIALILGLHLIHQVSFYQQWIARPNPTSMVDASWEMAQFINAENVDKMIPIIGEYSAQLALYDDKLMSLDAKWGSGQEMCKRVDYWRPKYHVNVIWPRSKSTRERDYIAQCKVVKGYEEISRHPIFKQWQDEIVLSRLIYIDNPK